VADVCFTTFAVAFDLGEDDRSLTLKKLRAINYSFHHTGLDGGTPNPQVRDRKALEAARSGETLLIGMVFGYLWLWLLPRIYEPFQRVALLVFADSGFSHPIRRMAPDFSPIARPELSAIEAYVWFPVYIVGACLFAWAGLRLVRFVYLKCQGDVDLN
jgi:hypothetical protein